MPATGMTLLVALLRRVGPSTTTLREEWKWVILPSGLALAGALLVAGAVIAIASRWRRSPRSITSTASEQLTEFRLLYEKGEMSREEFERIRTRLNVQIRGPGTAPAPAEAAPAAAQSATNEATATNAASVTPAPPPAPESGASEAPPTESSPST
jgi:hypothetical protein